MDELEQLLAELDGAGLLPNNEATSLDDELVDWHATLCEFFGEKKASEMKKTLDNENAIW